MTLVGDGPKGKKKDGERQGSGVDIQKEEKVESRN